MGRYRPNKRKVVGSEIIYSRRGGSYFSGAEDHSGYPDDSSAATDCRGTQDASPCVGGGPEEGREERDGVQRPRLSRTDKERVPGQPILLGSALAGFTPEIGFAKDKTDDLRHTHASLLLKAGIHPKAVSERLGHSSIMITLDRYSHLFPTLQQEVAERLDELLTSVASK